MSKFDSWFETEKDSLAELLRNDSEEALYKAFYAGYESGLDQMGKLYTGGLLPFGKND